MKIPWFILLLQKIQKRSLNVKVKFMSESFYFLYEGTEQSLINRSILLRGYRFDWLVIAFQLSYVKKGFVTPCREHEIRRLWYTVLKNWWQCVKELIFLFFIFLFFSFSASRNVTTDHLFLFLNSLQTIPPSLKFGSIRVLTGSIIMKSCVKIPLATSLCLLLVLLITCSANDNNSSKPPDKVSSFDQTLSNRKIL